MRTKPIGSIVGAIGGVVFVAVNAAGVPATFVWIVAAAVLFLAIMWFVVLRGPEVHQDPPSRSALRTYGISVMAMIVAIPAGSALISNVLEKPNAVLVWVVFVIGAHFLPFATAFHLPVFRWLSASLVIAAVIGAVPALANDSAVAAAWTGVAAGFLLLLFSLVGPRLTRREAFAATRPRMERPSGSRSTTRRED